SQHRQSQISWGTHMNIQESKAIYLKPAQREELINKLRVLRADPDEVLSVVEAEINAYRFAERAANYDLRQARALLQRLSKVSQEVGLLIEELCFYTAHPHAGLPDAATVSAARHMLHTALGRQWTPALIAQLHSAVPTLREISMAASAAQSAPLSLS